MFVAPPMSTSRHGSASGGMPRAARRARTAATSLVPSSRTHVDAGLGSGEGALIREPHDVAHVGVHPEGEFAMEAPGRAMRPERAEEIVEDRGVLLVHARLPPQFAGPA